MNFNLAGNKGTLAIALFQLYYLFDGIRLSLSWLTHFRPFLTITLLSNNHLVESSWNVMAHGDARKGNWRGNWRMEWVSSTLHTTSERGVSSFTTADAHNSAVSSRLNWRHRGLKWTRPFRRRTKSGFCVCAITFQTQSTKEDIIQSDVKGETAACSPQQCQSDVNVTSVRSTKGNPAPIEMLC